MEQKQFWAMGPAGHWHRANTVSLACVPTSSFPLSDAKKKTGLRKLGDKLPLLCVVFCFLPNKKNSSSTRDVFARLLRERREELFSFRVVIQATAPLDIITENWGKNTNNSPRLCVLTDPIWRIDCSGTALIHLPLGHVHLAVSSEWLD